MRGEESGSAECQHVSVSLGLRTALLTLSLSSPERVFCFSDSFLVKWKPINSQRVLNWNGEASLKMYLAGNWQDYLPAPHQCLSAQVLSLLGRNTRWNKNKWLFQNSCPLKFTYKIKWFFVLLLYPLGSCSTGCFMHKSFIADTSPIIFSRNRAVS